ncbi:MAG: ABC transporter permease subunit [Leptospiraceae bacterium]|nr:ABC transporter permease subunit [Leptospiraceae bacterium]
MQTECETYSTTNNAAVRFPGLDAMRTSMKYKPSRNSILIIALFEFKESVRNRWLLLYGAAFFLFGNLILYLSGENPIRSASSLLSLMLLLGPLFSLMFGSISFTDSLGFVELLAAQPIRRSDIYIGKWIGLSSGLSLSFCIGMGTGVLLRQGLDSSFFLLLIPGVLLTFCSVAIAFLAANLSRRREIVFGMVLSIWFYLFILHDLLIFGIVTVLGNYPLKVPLMVMVSLNPIDLIRVMVALRLDMSAMMGYSAALFLDFFGGWTGLLVGAILMSLWIGIPVLLGLHLFRKRNL